MKLGNKKVVLGISGGVDSSVAALLLKKQGYEVHGYFMNCRSEKSKWPTSIDWKEEEKNVRWICKKLGIDLHVKDCEEGYERNIISKMFEDYGKGLTPNPDILCNNVGKFPGLLKTADKIGAEWIATGHYVRVKHGKTGTEMFTGKDKKKDQSYFLVGLPQKILSRCLFPMGELEKEDVRKIAKRNKFPNWDKRSSRGICYLGKIDVKKFLHTRIKEKEGKVLSPEGREVGTHNGMMFFTIGERVRETKGFEISRDYRKETGNAKLFVAAKKGNSLIVAPAGDSSLKRKRVFLVGFKFIGKEERGKMKGRIRHLGEMHSGKLFKEEGASVVGEKLKQGASVVGAHPARDHARSNVIQLSSRNRSPTQQLGGKVKKRTRSGMGGKSRWAFEFDKGVEGVAEGQFLAVHKGERVVGGGEIRFR